MKEEKTLKEDNTLQVYEFQWGELPEHNMNRYFEIGIIVSVSVVFLVLMKSVYGLAGSLEELQKQIKNDTAYRNELVNYLLSHNMTVMNTQIKVNKLMNINTLETYELEAVVKGLMSDCQRERLSNLLLKLSI